jgi:hypothetical protein
MKVEDIALAEREPDDDIAMFVNTCDGAIHSFVIPRELLQHLYNSVCKKLKRRKK